MTRPFGWPPPPPLGIAFDITELVFLRAWAEARGLRMEIALDRVRAEQHYEETVLLYPDGSGVPTLTLWRTADAVVLARSQRPPQRFGFLSEALADRPVAAKRL